MNPIVPKTIRVVGIMLTALLIPVAILALLALQGTGGDHHTVMILYIAWALVNFIAVPFILLDFIMRYVIKSVIYLAVAHLALSLANMALVITGTLSGNNNSIMLVAIVTLPSFLYIIGLFTHSRQNAIKTAQT